MASDLDIVRAKMTGLEKKSRGSLFEKIEHIKGDHAAKGMLYSGKTIKEISAACIKEMANLKLNLLREIEWAIDNALMPSERSVSAMLNESIACLDKIQRESIAHCHRIIKLCNAPNAEKEIIDKITDSYNREISDLSLEVDKLKSKGRTNLIKLAFSEIVNFFKKLFSHGS